MDPLQLSELASIVGGHLLGGNGGDCVVEHVATHSARIRSGAAFFALDGSRVDGHAYVGAAASNGAVAAVVASDRVGAVGPAAIPLIVVSDPLRSLQRLAAWWRASLPTEFVAVVGSNGKTITKDCLVHLLSSVRPVYGTPGSYNSQLGVPLTILDCPRTATVAVIEVAVSEPGEMAHIARIVAPDHLILTNVGTRWRYRFAGRDDQIRELLSITTGSRGQGWLLLGETDEDLVAAAGAVALNCRVQGAEPGLPIFRRTPAGPGGANLNITFPAGDIATVRVRTPSEEILSDVELAVSAATLLGVDSRRVVDTLNEYTPTATRMEIWRSPSGVTLVRDIATPDPMAVTSALRAAKRLTSHGGRTVVVLGTPAATWEAGTATELARALTSERADEVLAIRSELHELTARVVEELDDLIPVRLFDSPEGLRRQLIDNLAYGDVCLVQSPPGSRIDDLSRALVEAMAPTRLYLDMSAMEENITTFRRLVGPSVRIMAMVKALAYGTDAVAVSLGLHETGVDVLGVSAVDEGIALRRAGIQLPILVMLATEDEVEKMVRHRLTPLLYSESMVTAVAAFAKERPDIISVHVEVDTGMHRTGLTWDDRSTLDGSKSAIECIDELTRLENVRIEGLMTHLASTDEPAHDSFTREQLRRFDDVVSATRALGVSPLLHAAATAGAIRFPEARYDMVRIGLGLFGLHPSAATAREVSLAPAISLVSRIVQTMDVPPGEGVGYGSTWLAPEDGGRVGVVPAGYHDCIPRSFSNFGYVVVGGVKCAIVGAVSMDSMTIDLSACPTAMVGSDVLIYGQFGDSHVPLEEVSKAIDTIPYEVMARVGPRVQRILTRH